MKTGEYQPSAATRFYRDVRFHLFWYGALHDVPGRERELQGHAHCAFYLLEEAERHRFGGRYRR